MPAFAQATVTVRVTPAGAAARRVGARVMELLQSTGVRPFLQYGFARSAESPGSLAHVTIAIDSAGANALVEVAGASFAPVTRAVPLMAGMELDETAREEMAQIVVSSIGALLVDEPVEEPRAAAPLAAAEAPPAPNTSTSTERARADAAAAVARPALPAVIAGAPVFAQAAEPAPVSVAESQQPPAAATPPAGGQLQVLAGYAFEVWGDGHVLDGPWVALGYTIPFAGARWGARLQGWFALTSELDGAQLTAEASAQAIRLLLAYESASTQGVALELAAGLDARVTTLRAIEPGAGLVAQAEPSLPSWGAHLYCGGVWILGPFRLVLGAGLDLDPVAVEFGVRDAGGAFTSTHAAARVRPSLEAGAGVSF